MSSSFWAIQAAKNKKNELVPGTSKWVANELYSMNSDVLTHTETFYYGISNNVQELNEFMKGVVAGQDDKSLLLKLLAQEEEEEREEEEKETSKDQKTLKGTNGTAEQDKIERDHSYSKTSKPDSTLEADTTNGYENIMSPRLSPIMNNTTVTTQKTSKYTPKTPSPLKSDALSEKASSNADLSFIPIANTINPNKLDTLDNRQTDKKRETSGDYASARDDSFKAISTAIRKSIADKSGPNFAVHTRQTGGYDMFAKELSTGVSTESKDRDTRENLKSDENHVNASLKSSSRKRQTRTPKQIARTPKRTSVFVSLPSREPLTISSSSSKSVSGLSSMKGKPLKLFEKLDNASKFENMLSSMQQSPVTIKKRKIPFENEGSTSISSTFIKESMKRRSLVKPIPLGGVKGRESQNVFDKRASYTQSNKEKTQNEEQIHAVLDTHTHKLPSSTSFMRMPNSIHKDEIQNEITTEENFQKFKHRATAVAQGQSLSNVRKKSENVFLVDDKSEHNEGNARGTFTMHKTTGLHTEHRSALHTAMNNDNISSTSGNEMGNKSIKSPTLNSADSVLRRARNVFLTNSKSAGSQYDTTGISSTTSPYKSGYGPSTRRKSPIRLPTVTKPRKMSTYSPRNYEKPKRSPLVSPVRQALKKSLRDTKSPLRVTADAGNGEFKHLQGKAESDLISRLMAPTSSSAAKSVRTSNRIKENEINNTSKNKFLTTTLNPNKSNIPLKSMEKTSQLSHSAEKIPDETIKETKIPLKVELNNIPPLKKKSLMAERSEAAAQKPKQKIVIAMNHKLDTKVPQNLIPIKGNGRELKERNTPIDHDYMKGSLAMSDVPDLQISNFTSGNEQVNAEGYRRDQRELMAEHKSIPSQGLVNKTKQNETKTPNILRTSFHKTPKRKQIKDLEALKTPSEKQTQHTSNVLPDIPTDEEDLKSQKALQSWAESPQLRKILLQNRNIDPVSIFGEVPRLDIDEIFESQASRSRGKASPIGYNNRKT